MMSWNMELKAVIVTALAGLLAYFKIIAVPILVLFVFMVLDYITGLCAAWVKRKLSSRTGIIGIVKKVMYFVLIAVGIGADWLINFGLCAIDIHFEYGYLIGLFVTISLTLPSLSTDTARITAALSTFSRGASALFGVISVRALRRF